MKTIKTQLTEIKSANQSVLNELLAYKTRNSNDGGGWANLEEGVKASAINEANRLIIVNQLKANPDVMAYLKDGHGIDYEANYLVAVLVNNW